MTPDYDPYACLALARAVVELAMKDFRELRKMTAIQPDLSVNATFWGRRHDSYDTRGYFHPKNYASARDARALVEFFQGPWLEEWCRMTGPRGLKASRVRSLIRISKA